MNSLGKKLFLEKSMHERTCMIIFKRCEVHSQRPAGGILWQKRNMSTLSMKPMV